MKTKLLMLVFVFLVSGIEASAQVAPNDITLEPAPTLQQCRADLDAWSKIDSTKDYESHFTYDDLEEMARAMVQCGVGVDSAPRSPGVVAAKYYKVFMTINSCITSRYFDFIFRHDELRRQFEKEDKAGAR
jgi:hypothetical protein